jgi:hypothetical protein
MFSKAVPQLIPEETPTGTALQVFLTARGISPLQIGFVIDQLPWATMRCGK